MNESKLVTVLSMCHNHGRYLPECIESITHQTIRDQIQYIVVNAASTDDTERIMVDYRGVIDLGITLKEDLGLCTSRNKGYQFAEGRFGLTLDADDKLTPDAIERMAAIMHDNIIVCPGIREFSEVTGPALNTVAALGWGTTHADFRQNNRIFCASMFPIAAFKEVDMYDPGLDQLGWEDWMLWTKLVERGCRVKMLGKVVFWHRGSSSAGHPGSSTTKTAARHEERVAYFRKHGFKI